MATKEVHKTKTTLQVVKGLANTEEVQTRFREILGRKAPAFMASLISIVGSNINFNGIDPNSIVSAALIAATLDLPINPNLGFAYIIPYKGKTTKAQFQMGYKGFIQLAERTGLYKTISACEVFDGEIISINKFKAEYIFDSAKKKSDKVVGYYAFFKLIAGFEKENYMSVEEIQYHGKRYSKNYYDENGQWKQNFPGMALKTVLKLLLSKYGMLSTELQRAIQGDQAIIKQNANGDDFDYEYTDVEEAKEQIPEPESLSKPKEEKQPAQDSETETDPNLSDPQFYIDCFNSFTTIKDADNFAKAQAENIQKFDNEAANKINQAYMKVCKELAKGK